MGTEEKNKTSLRNLTDFPEHQGRERRRHLDASRHTGDFELKDNGGGPGVQMFGLLVSGRLVDTAFRQVDQTHFVIDVHQPDAFNHVVVCKEITKSKSSLTSTLK